MAMVQLRLPWSASEGARQTRDRSITVAGRQYPIVIARHHWARRYVLRVLSDGRLRLTVPRRASIGDGLMFVAGQAAWIAAEWARHEQLATWGPGTKVWYRGERVALVCESGAVRCGPDLIVAGDRTGSLRAVVEAHFRAVAKAELPERCRALAAIHGVTPGRLSVRNQRSRWGSCSGTRTIALNWRLVQMSPEVADYVMVHELVHLEHPNHSRRFWRRVEEWCPAWRAAERWLRLHGRELM